MNTNQQPNNKPQVKTNHLSLVLKSREMTAAESAQYQSWLDGKDYEQDFKY